MDGDVFDAGLVGGLGEGDEVVLVGVDAAIGDEAEEVEPLAFGHFECLGEVGDIGELVFLDAEIDAGEVLVDDAAGSEVEVADLGVAHLAVWEADVEPRGADGRDWVIGVERLVERRLGEEGGVTVLLGIGGAVWVDAPAVADD